MLEFLVALLLSMGLPIDGALQFIKENPDLESVIKTSDSYQEYGGDEAFNKLYIDDDYDNQDKIVVTEQVDPAYIH